MRALPAFDAELLAAAPACSRASRFLQTCCPTCSSNAYLAAHARAPPHLTHSRCPTSSTCPPPLRRASCLTAAPVSQPALAPGRVMLRIANTLHDGLLGAVWRAWQRAEGARACTRAGCGRAHAWAAVGCPGEYGWGARATRAVSRGHFR